MPRPCNVCKHEYRLEIEHLFPGGIGCRTLADIYGGIEKDGVQRHFSGHHPSLRQTPDSTIKFDSLFVRLVLEDVNPRFKNIALMRRKNECTKAGDSEENDIRSDLVILRKLRFNPQKVQILLSADRGKYTAIKAALRISDANFSDMSARCFRAWIDDPAHLGVLLKFRHGVRS